MAWGRGYCPGDLIRSVEQQRGSEGELQAACAARAADPAARARALSMRERAAAAQPERRAAGAVSGPPRAYCLPLRSSLTARGAAAAAAAAAAPAAAAAAAAAPPRGAR